MLRIFSAVCLILMTSTAIRASAQVYPYRDGTPGLTGYRSEVMAEIMIQESEFVRLAEAIPAEKYTWRPSPDVRTCTQARPTTTCTNSWVLQRPRKSTRKRWKTPLRARKKSLPR
jgi:hypothetical protein